VETPGCTQLASPLNTAGINVFYATIGHARLLKLAPIMASAPDICNALTKLNIRLIAKDLLCAAVGMV
jgi:hypothetical protein